MMSVSVTGVAVVAMLAAVVRANECPSGYEYNVELDACYKYYDQPVCVRDADGTCSRDRADLCSIHSKQENDFVGDFIKRNTHDGSVAAWIGLHRNPSNGDLYWADWTYVNYKDFTRDPFSGKFGARCAYYVPTSTAVYGGSRWIADSCSRKRPYVCKISKNSRRIKY